MDQLPLYASKVFGGWGGSSCGGGLRDVGRMCPRRRGGWWRGWKRLGTSSSSYRPRSAVGLPCGHMLLYARPNRGDVIFYRWWRPTLLVADKSIRGVGGAKREVRNFVRKCNE